MSAKKLECNEWLERMIMESGENPYAVNPEIYFDEWVDRHRKETKRVLSDPLNAFQLATNKVRQRISKKNRIQ